MPAWKLTIDFGEEIGVRRSSAQITNYERSELEDTLVVAVVNFPPKQIGPFMSECLVIGALNDEQRRDPAAPRPPSGARRPDRLAFRAMDTRVERIVLETDRHRIVGDLTMPREGYRSRLSDYLNRGEQAFIPLANAVISDDRRSPGDRRARIHRRRAHPRSPGLHNG